MGEYTLTVHIDEPIREAFAREGQRFCFARIARSESTEATFNVVASADLVTPMVRVKWKDEYGMTASQTNYTPGAQFQVDTPVRPVKYGDSYTVDQDLGVDVQRGPTVPTPSFHFQTSRPTTAILYETVDDVMVPVYITPRPAAPNSNDTIVPTPEIAVWFQKDVEAGEMIDQNMVNAYVFSMTGPTAHLTFNAEGQWVRTE